MVLETGKTCKTDSKLLIEAHSPSDGSGGDGDGAAWGLRHSSLLAKEEQAIKKWEKAEFGAGWEVQEAAGLEEWGVR